MIVGKTDGVLLACCIVGNSFCFTCEQRNAESNDGDRLVTSRRMDRSMYRETCYYAIFWVVITGIMKGGTEKCEVAAHVLKRFCFQTVRGKPSHHATSNISSCNL